MGPLNALKCVYKNYFNYDDRSGLSEFWFFLIIVCGGYASFIIMTSTGTIPLEITEDVKLINAAVYFLVILLPLISVSFRRLHDSGKSGWFVFLVLVPGIGFLILLNLLALPGTKGPNEYADEPLPPGGY